MKIDARTIAARIEDVTLTEAELEPAVAAEIAFHMTDWLDDLEAWHRFCVSPESCTKPELRQLLVRFLSHVPNHLAAASKLFLDIPVTDIFKVGATTDPDDFR